MTGAVLNKKSPDEEILETLPVASEVLTLLPSVNPEMGLDEEIC